jgi:hypothetical protein
MSPDLSPAPSRTSHRPAPRAIVRAITRLVACGAVVLPSAFAASTVPAHAVTVFQRSVYTTLDLATCRKLASRPDGDSHLCKGLPDHPVYVAEGDGRTFLAASLTPQTARAATQTLAAFNSPFAKRGRRTTIEWRVVIRGGRRVPYATIVRYFTSRDGASGEVLVVARVDGAQTCHVAHIDALANDDAIVRARRIADGRARTFDCAHPPTVVGATGRSPM